MYRMEQVVMDWVGLTYMITFITRSALIISMTVDITVTKCRII